MIQAILKRSPQNRVILVGNSVTWPDKGNGQVLSVTDDPQSPYPAISWDETYSMIKNASSLLLPANV
jgi:hypothetical protein